MSPTTNVQRIWPALLAGIFATLVGIGLARFAYTPLIPVLIESGWFDASDAVYLGAANLLGYLIGALAAHRLTERFAPRLIVGLSLSIVTLGFLLCSWPAGFYWFFVWRFLSGAAGAILMVVVPSMVLSRTAIAHRSVVGTLAFSGIGIGVVLSAFVVPALLSLDLTFTWLVLGLLSGVCALACDQGIKRMPKPELNAASAFSNGSVTKSISTIVVLVMLAYGLDAAGFIPHTVFWVDYLARENGFGQAAASLQWGIFGLGALCGPFVVSLFVARLGWANSLTLAFALKTMAILLPVLSLALVSQAVSSFLVGAFGPGMAALTSGRLAQIVGPSGHKQAWGQATAIFAITQTVSGYMMSAAYDVLDTYTPLYVVGSALLLLGTLLVYASASLQSRAR
ncbi:MAG: MFS transporter [Burkholderiaceae bacterium]|nr:MFS transporter [Burkholderiaceae bacterium]MCD8517586.1 MFS transporter [Burkholderiaceae bacterium]MCD8537379.1 MFS transporter [Burkholderiaceae bacterium]